jgi:leucyl/phenylalanyl-tRNA--protein transferase
MAGAFYAAGGRARERRARGGRRLPVFRLSRALVFPPAEQAEPGGLLAVGGDLSPERLLLAYASGIFPWYSAGQPVLWHSPDPRFVLPPAELHVPRRVRRRVRHGACPITLDRAFARVIRACAEVPRPGQHGTWITPEMIQAYERLHAEGYAHSAEAWEGEVLVGGVYGVALGGAFSGESMFTLRPDASKLALVTLLRQLAAWGFTLFDAQMPSEHVRRLGGREWPRERFLRELARALELPTRRGRWTLELEEPPRVAP